MKPSFLVIALLLALPAFPDDRPAAGPDPEPASKRIFGIVPNYRSSPFPANYTPLSVKEKFKIAEQDSFDRGTVVLGALFALQSQATNANPSFGQGAAGYARYFGTSYGDFVIGNMLTEGVLPSALHQDPRFFTQAEGSGWSRLGHAAAQIFVTRNDSGRRQFNYSEVLGNSAAVAISQAYYQDNRTASEAGSKLATQLAVDMASNVLKEFWPDVKRKFSRKHVAASFKP